ncbi:MAG: EscU/YscU/HrcU family type III secretion system export apparatus switch protein [Ottowia sp.]|nr:EscU/YscU/HrcU family type III secretion system export apparatus switch protein [Ottowia sp.]
MSEKTEQPTHKHRQDARKKGQVAKSVEVISGIQLLALYGYFSFQGPMLLEKIKALITSTIDVVNQPIKPAMGHVMSLFMQIFMQFMGAMALVVIFATVFSVIGQIGPLLALEALQPKLSHISPLNNLKQLFSIKSLFEFAKSTLKVAILSIIFIYLLRHYAASLQFLPLCGAVCGLNVAAQLLSWMWAALICFYILFGIADFAFQKYTTTKQLMMSKEEVKREYKDSEGDPEIKHRRKEVHREMQSGSLAKNVAKSTVVIRNPTHLAICLYYRQGETPLPEVIEKGREARAAHIVALAEKAGVPIVEHVPLAHKLMNNVEVGDTIPAMLFEPVAQILRIVMNLDYESADNPPSP